jgi:hypothetical protein
MPPGSKRSVHWLLLRAYMPRQPTFFFLHSLAGSHTRAGAWHHRHSRWGQPVCVASQRHDRHANCTIRRGAAAAGTWFGPE